MADGYREKTVSLWADDKTKQEKVETTAAPPGKADFLALKQRLL